MDTSHNTDERFVDYYAEQSTSHQTQQRFDSVRRALLLLRSELGFSTTSLDVVDIGCGAGSQAIVWALDGHRARGVDISAPLIALARQRAADESLSAEFLVGNATALPLGDTSCDVVLISELLEHVPDWIPCLNEALRVLRPGGVIYFSTTNRLCPVQQEFKLPLYSWYPAVMKRYCERLAVTTHPQWVQYTSLPAVNWFTFYQLREYLRGRGVIALDRFDLMQPHGSFLRAAVAGAARRFSALRLLGHVLTPYTVVAGVKTLTAAPKCG
jgi:2-polyprenyl-6-hydroxyphenyl methylase/3-demethylubiquinone-9 3-methyltransferase